MRNCWLFKTNEKLERALINKLMNSTYNMLTKTFLDLA